METVSKGKIVSKIDRNMKNNIIHVTSKVSLIVPIELQTQADYQTSRMFCSHGTQVMALSVFPLQPRA